MGTVPRILVFFIVSSLVLAWLLLANTPRKSSLRFDPTFDPRKSWGAYTPFFPVHKYAPPPAGCQVIQVNILQRHGARFPTSGASINIVSAVQKLKNADAYTHPSMQFMSNFVYTLGTNDLVPFGARQSSDAGAITFKRYAHLFDANNIPFVRASSGTRVVDSATNWTEGFAAASHGVYRPPLSVILSEEGNDTLESHMCPNAGSSDPQTDEWLNVYAPAITTRLNSWAPGAKLTDHETHALISLCAFHTAALGNPTTPSPVCGLFTPSDFAGFDYSADLDKYYHTGYGASLGRVQGVGYANELLARLTGTPVRDNTQTNRTLDADPTTFPLNRTLYADFSHDNAMIACMSAIGLFRQPEALSTVEPDPQRTWHTHAMVPFSGRMVVEKLNCDETEFVRILVNDALQPLEFCGTGTGICTLEAFVQSQSYAQSDGDGDWDRCFR
ncbi:phytase [Roridomyces roridus]|uniref:Phytase A n=1 Tax=Roridomyces roridus TaxID=1738132 RepID=A0AAD7BXE6_9AGAR|nr:phytase [Roridomyces roridus]